MSRIVKLVALIAVITAWLKVCLETFPFDSWSEFFGRKPESKAKEDEETIDVKHEDVS